MFAAPMVGHIENPCVYLFGKDAKELFPGYKSEVVNQMLVTLMRVVDYLVMKKPDSLFIFHPNALNNQCHLYSLIVVRRILQMQNFEEANIICQFHPTARALILDYFLDSDPRFLYLSFFLSNALFKDFKSFCKTVKYALKEMGCPQIKRSFLVDLSGNRIVAAARVVLNKLFAEHMKRVLSENRNHELLYEELSRIANSDSALQLAPNKGASEVDSATFYTLPEVVGVIYMIDTIARENIPVIYKVRVITAEGSARFCYTPEKGRALNPQSPVMVIELVATEAGTLSFVEYREMAKRCSYYLKHNKGRNQRHELTATCIHCTPKTVTAVSYRQKIELILTRSREMLLALAANFVQQQQRAFLRYFNDREQYPMLTRLFEESVMTQPGSLSVFQVTKDTARNALRNTLLIDNSYRGHLRERRLIPEQTAPGKKVPEHLRPMVRVLNGVIGSKYGVPLALLILIAEHAVAGVPRRASGTEELADKETGEVLVPLNRTMTQKPQPQNHK